MAQISDINIDEIPLKLIEMGCLPGNTIELIQVAPMGDPLFFNINDSKVAIRKKQLKKSIFYKNLFNKCILIP